jgi:hypothetical protein
MPDWRDISLPAQDNGAAARPQQWEVTSAEREGLGGAPGCELRPLDMRSFILNAGALVTLLAVDLINIGLAQGWAQPAAVNTACDGVRSMLIQCLTPGGTMWASGWYACDGR